MAMMNELVDQISQRTGLSREKAMGAARAAVDFLDERLPAPVAGRIKPLVEGGSEDSDGGPMEGLGKKFGL